MSHTPKPLKIFKWPKDATTLRCKSDAVPIDMIPALQDFIDDMIATMYEAEGYGLSAIQVGNDLRVFVMDNGKGPEVFINPEIVGYPGNIELMDEGCLSFPGMREDVERYNAITVKYLDRLGAEKTETRTGTDAQCIQHEMDHFYGTLLSDNLSPLKRSRWAAKLK